MCGLVIEILFLAAGLWLIFTGKVPHKFFNTLFGKGQYTSSPTNARLFGLLLASPLPVVFGVSFLLGLAFGEDSLRYSFVFETVYVLAVAIIAIIVAKKMKQQAIVS